MNAKGAGSTRAYRSELRAEQAQQTRTRILAAAASEFSRSGYQATTIAAIARAAGVSAETVKSAGSKADLLVRSFEIVFAGVEQSESLIEGEDAAALLTLPDDEFVTGATGLIAAANAASCRLWTVLLGASLSDELVADALRAMLDNRHRDYLGLVNELRRRGIARTDLAVEGAAAELSFLMSPEGYQQLVLQSGWSDAEYRAWLTAGILRVVSGV